MSKSAPMPQFALRSILSVHNLYGILDLILHLPYTTHRCSYDFGWSYSTFTLLGHTTKRATTAELTLGTLLGIIFVMPSHLLHFCLPKTFSKIFFEFKLTLSFQIGVSDHKLRRNHDPFFRYPAQYNEITDVLWNAYLKVLKKPLSLHRIVVLALAPRRKSPPSKVPIHNLRISIHPIIPCWRVLIFRITSGI